MSIQAIKALIVQTSAYFGQKFEDHVVQMFAEDLADLPVEKVASALKELRRDPKTTRFPLPAAIRAVAKPTLVPEHEAIEAASRIIAAVARIGSYRSDDARQEVGELAWAIVQSEGGWENVCQMLTHDNLSILRAQWKHLAVSKLAQAKGGQFTAQSRLSLRQESRIPEVLPDSEKLHFKENNHFDKEV
ncbi:MAG: hypothetical protein A2X94_00835 [Bdellovibrionales bacterium GWB1_55_8]|nr:MAG: hypothetical protein A2X94_00835 [Bdellovibrionales bacterium GWB1_55_8]